MSQKKPAKSRTQRVRLLTSITKAFAKPLSRQKPFESPAADACRAAYPTRATGTRSEILVELDSIIDSRSETQIMDNPSCLLCLLEGCLRRSLCFSADNSVEMGQQLLRRKSFSRLLFFPRFPCFIFDEWPKLSGRL